ncbi:translation initiation factor IF-2-like isoform X2 [Sphaerodactylus townsendi]|uniref:translation initiation factor IF-2-like isoform X2 n=1 Tax=Sphaerodactylus townsendi TaxID=933632 RepID=UPI002025F170|nr:translation initiation factor IF-2-like isoform X2 [Sphaerodactylus townsendi]
MAPAKGGKRKTPSGGQGRAKQAPKVRITASSGSGASRAEPGPSQRARKEPPLPSRPRRATAGKAPAWRNLDSPTGARAGQPTTSSQVARSKSSQGAAARTSGARRRVATTPVNRHSVQGVAPAPSPGSQPGLSNLSAQIFNDLANTFARLAKSSSPGGAVASFATTTAGPSQPAGDQGEEAFSQEEEEEEEVLSPSSAEEGEEPSRDRHRKKPRKGSRRHASKRRSPSSSSIGVHCKEVGPRSSSKLLQQEGGFELGSPRS